MSSRSLPTPCTVSAAGDGYENVKRWPPQDATISFGKMTFIKPISVDCFEIRGYDLTYSIEGRHHNPISIACISFITFGARRDWHIHACCVLRL